MTTKILKSIKLAARNMDWQQVVLNGGPPCFCLQDDGNFCGRAQIWHSTDTHGFVSLEELLKERASEAINAVMDVCFCRVENGKITTEPGCPSHDPK